MDGLNQWRSGDRWWRVGVQDPVRDLRSLLQVDEWSLVGFCRSRA